MLATFWANVLQHEQNYPPARFTYVRQRSSGRGRDEDGRPQELLRLTIEDEDVSLLVAMSTGVLTAAGKFVYAWFIARFRQILENVDARFARDWVFMPTPTGDLPLSNNNQHQLDEKTGHHCRQDSRVC